MEPQMAFIDDARHSTRHSGKAFCGSHDQPWPRQYYTLAAIGTSLLLWAVLILTVLHLF
jgi:hypothetical protein